MKINKILFRLKCVFYVKKDIHLSTNEKYSLITRKRRLRPIPYSEKSKYMNSSEWQTMGKIWLHEKGYRCQMFPFIILGQHKPKGKWWNESFHGKYAIHHISKNSYENLGKEELDKDVIVLSKFAHEWVYHYILSFGARKVRDQKLLKFPNILQVIANWWCSLSLKKFFNKLNLTKFKKQD